MFVKKLSMKLDKTRFTFQLVVLSDYKDHEMRVYAILGTNIYLIMYSYIQCHFPTQP